MSIQSDKMVFYYMQRENLCFLTLTEESYPKRLAFLYLEDVAEAVLQELTREFSGEVSNCRFIVRRTVSCLELLRILSIDTGLINFTFLFFNSGEQR